MNKKIELKKGSMGTASLVTGIIGLFICPFVLSTLAIIFGAIAMSRNERYGKCGMILGIIGWCCMLIMFFVFVSLLGAMF